MSDDLQAIIKRLHLYGSKLVKNLCPRPSDPHGLARAEAVWKRFRRTVIDAGAKLADFPEPVVYWLQELGQLVSQLDQLVRGERIDSVVGRFDFALFESLIAEGEQLLAIYAPRSAGPFAAFFGPLPTTLTTNTTATETQPDAGERPGADDPFADLRRFARAQLKGQERTLIEALCDAGGELPLADVKAMFDWQDPIESAWNSLRIRLNKKLEPHGWKVKTQGRAARLTRPDTE